MAFYGIAAGYALWRGGAPERWFAVILVLMLATDRIGHQIIGSTNLEAIDRLHLFIDFASFGAMVLVMVRARRFWPIWACSFQLLSLASHATSLMNAGVPPIIPAVLAVAPSYLLCVSLVLGTVLHQARLRRHGNDPPWRTF